ncbi:hypothetical protein ACJZ2D_016230 [Fusarium nematophilum]
MSTVVLVTSVVCAVAAALAVGTATYCLLRCRTKQRHTDSEDRLSNTAVSSDALVPLEPASSQEPTRLHRPPEQHPGSLTPPKRYAIFLQGDLKEKADSYGINNPMTLPQPGPPEFYINPRLEYSYPDCPDDTASITIDGAHRQDVMGRIIDFDKSKVKFRVFLDFYGVSKEVTGVEKIFCHRDVDNDIEEALSCTGVMTVLDAKTWRDLLKELGVKAG